MKFIDCHSLIQTLYFGAIYELPSVLIESDETIKNQV